jgi:alpha-galactosidase/6-phospho-beta-glucosidase family protein
MARQRQAADEALRANLERPLDAAFWSNGSGSIYERVDEDIFVQALTGIAGIRPVKLVASFPNRGAVAGFTDRTVLEYSQILHRKTIKPAGRYVLPPVIQGLTSALATHQTMLADACGTDDPRLLARALLAYPVRPYSQAAKAMYRELLELNRAEIPPALYAARQFL